MGLTPRDVLSALFRYWRVLAAFWLLVLLSGLIAYSQTKRLYESRAKLLVSLGTEALGKADYVNGRNVVLQQREQQIHKSHEVMLAAAQWILGEPTQSSPVPPMATGMIEEARRFLTSEAATP